MNKLRQIACALLLITATLASITYANADAVDDIQRSKVIKVCIWPDYFGISYRNPRTGALQGIDIELSQAFASDLGAKVEYVETNFSQVIDDLVSHKCQIAMMGVGITPDRAEKVRFSKPYLRSDLYAIAMRSNSSINQWDDIDKPGKVVIVQKGTFMEPVMKELLKQATLGTTVKPGEREKEVESGRADVFITDYPYSQRMLQNTDWAKVVAPNKPIRPTEYAYPVAPNEDRLLEKVNAFVNAIKKDGRLATAAKNYNLQPIVIKD